MHQILNLLGCVNCQNHPLSCDCREDQVCVFNPGRCFKCPHTSCLDAPQRCIECPLALPDCSCADASQCAYQGQTCDSCAHYLCGPDEDACPPVERYCTQTCSSSEKCAVRRDKETGCMVRKCVPKDPTIDETSQLIDACQSCTQNEECRLVAGQRRCVPIEELPCISCPAIDTNKKCGPHEHLVIEPNTCHQCGHAKCVADPCYNCLTYPIPIPCKENEDSVLIPPSCYDCGKYTCVKKSQPEPECIDCNGSCVVSDIENGIPLTECIPNKCVECPSKASCTDVQCPEGSVCKLSDLTCDLCPKATCVKKVLEDCPPATCAATLCPVDTQCVIREAEGACPRAECVNPDDCIICPQVMPSCHCPDQSHCQFVKQNCFQCAHFKCVQPPKCPPAPKCEATMCPSGYTCEEVPGDTTSCPSVVCMTKNCLSCYPLLPHCTDCDRDEVCRITLGSCEQCAASECNKNPDCTVCPTEPQHCACKENEVALFKPGSCHECPSCECIVKPCIKCPDRDVVEEDCAKCKEDERCEISPRTCYTCEQGKCVSKCVQCDPRLAQCNCKPSEVCRVTPGTCETCPVAVCEPVQPACKPVSCTCKPEETIELFTDENGCPACRCLPLKCEANQQKFPVFLGKELSHVCVNTEDIRKCDPTLPQCTCENPSDCIYETRTFESCAEYKCRKKCIQCPSQAPPCQCSSPSECVLQPRTCDRCGQYYCRDECVSCPEGEQPCPCKDPNDCVLRPRTCLFCPYYECIPPSKRSRL